MYVRVIRTYVGATSLCVSQTNSAIFIVTHKKAIVRVFTHGCAQIDFVFGPAVIEKTVLTPPLSLFCVQTEIGTIC